MSDPVPTPPPEEPPHYADRPSVPLVVASRFDLWLVAKALIGLPLIGFGAWIVYKDVAPDGHVELMTAVIGLVFCTAGGGILNMTVLREFGDFVKNIVPTIRGK